MINKISSYGMGLILAAGILSACGGKKDDDLVYDAQDCLNRSTAATALSCTELLGTLDTQASNLLRCAAYFKREGISDPNTLAEIGEQMGSSGDSSVMTMMSALAFDDVNSVTAASDYCNKSGSKGLIMLASMSKIATVTLAASNALGPNPSAADLQNVICGGDNVSDTTSATNEVIGEAVIAAYQSGCIGTNGASVNPYCGMVTGQTDAANSGSTSASAIGEQFADALCNP